MSLLKLEDLLEAKKHQISPTNCFPVRKGLASARTRAWQAVAVVVAGCGAKALPVFGAWRDRLTLLCLRGRSATAPATYDNPMDHEFMDAWFRHVQTTFIAV